MLLIDGEGHLTGLWCQNCITNRPRIRGNPANLPAFERAAEIVEIFRLSGKDFRFEVVMKADETPAEARHRQYNKPADAG